MAVTSVASESPPHRFLGRAVAFEHIILICVVNLLCKSAHRKDESAAYTKATCRKKNNACFLTIERGAAYKQIHHL